MKKYIFIFLCLAVIIISAVSCGHKEIIVSEDADVYNSAATVLNTYKDTCFTEVKLLYMDSENEEERIDPLFTGLYFGSGNEDIDMSIIKNYAILEPLPVEASQFGIIETFSAENAATAAEWIELRFKHLTDVYSSYLPIQEDIAEKVVIRTAGNYVYYCACTDVDAVLSTIEAELISPS